MERREPFLISVKDVFALGAYRPTIAIASSAGRILRYDYHGSIGLEIRTASLLLVPPFAIFS